MDELRARVWALGRRRLEDQAPRIELSNLMLDPPTPGLWRRAILVADGRLSRLSVVAALRER